MTQPLAQAEAQPQGECHVLFAPAGTAEPCSLMLLLLLAPAQRLAQADAAELVGRRLLPWAVAPECYESDFPLVTCNSSGPSISQRSMQAYLSPAEGDIMRVLIDGQINKIKIHFSANGFIGLQRRLHQYFFTTNAGTDGAKLYLAPSAPPPTPCVTTLL
mgnify:CR=1 FL=1